MGSGSRNRPVYDPATGYSNARRAERLLGNAVLLTVARYGHPSHQLPGKCTDKWRVRYLVQLSCRYLTGSWWDGQFRYFLQGRLGLAVGHPRGQGQVIPSGGQP